jgi:hypothetical protein
MPCRASHPESVKPARPPIPRPRRRAPFECLAAQPRKAQNRESGRRIEASELVAVLETLDRAPRSGQANRRAPKRPAGVSPPSPAANPGINSIWMYHRGPL